MLLHRPETHGDAGREELCARFPIYYMGEWDELLRRAHSCLRASRHVAGAASSDNIRRAGAWNKDTLGVLSYGGRELTAPPLARGNADTLATLRDP